MIKQSLQRQFSLWTVLLLVVPSLLIMAIYTVAQIQVSKQQNLELISQRVQSQERLINYWMTERNGDVHNLSRLEVVRNLDEQQMKRTLYSTQQDNKNFDSLSFIDKDGYFKISTLEGGISYTTAFDRPYFQAALAGKDYISDVVIGRNSGMPIINFSSPVYDYAGNFQGLILGSVKTTTLETLLIDNQIGQTGEIVLVNREGTMLTEPRNVDVLIAKGLVTGTAKMRLKMSDDAFRNIRLGEAGTATWINYMGDKALGAYQGMPERGWTLIGEINEREVLTPIYNQLAMMASGTIFLILLILPLAMRLTNRIKQPIEWLIRQSKLVTAADYKLVGRDKCSENIPYELSALCETFVNMGHKIEDTVGLLKEKESKLESKVVEIQDINAILEEEIMERQAAQEALQHLNAELETRVLERTSELQDLNAILEEEIAERQVVQESLLNSEAQLKHYTAELTETNKELKAFANIVAHDFRAPMVNIKGFSRELSYTLADLKQIVQEEMSQLPEKTCQRLTELLDKDVPDSLQFIHSSVDRLERMVAALLKLARQGRREMIYEKVDMRELTGAILSSFEHQIMLNDIQVEVGVLPTIETDHLAMEQIISNLLDNAIKYLEPCRTGKISISCTDSGDEWLISVQDNGRGIASVDTEKIFEIFRRVGVPDVPGEGMGLAYVRTMIRHLGGRVWCESELGVGTIMKFTVPNKPNL